MNTNSTPKPAVAMPPREVRHLMQIDVARRWRISERTLEAWRWRGKGPAFLRLGGRIAYRLADIEAYEASNFHDIDRTR